MSTIRSGLSRWVVSVLALCGCNLSDETVYLHTPTEEVHDGMSLSKSQLAPFRVDDVVATVVVRSRHSNNQNVFFVWIAPYATSKKKVSVRQAVLQSTGGAVRHSFPKELSAVTDRDEGKGRWSASLLLGEIPEAEMPKLVSGGVAQLSFEWKVGDEGTFQPLRMDISPKKITRWATH